MTAMTAMTAITTIVTNYNFAPPFVQARLGNSIDMGTGNNTNNSIDSLIRTEKSNNGSNDGTSNFQKNKILQSEATARRRLFENFLVCLCQQTIVAEINIQNKCIVEAKQSIVLDDCNIDDVDALTLVSCLKGSKTITELNLVSNRISDAGATAIAGYIGLPNCKLQFVDLRNNGISLNGIKKLAEALQNNTGRGIEHVYVHNDGRVDAIGAKQSVLNTDDSEEKKSGESSNISLNKIRDAMTSVCVIDCRENFPDTVAKLNEKIGVPMGTANTLWAKINAELPDKEAVKIKAMKKKALLQRKKNSEYRDLMVESIYS